MDKPAPFNITLDARMYNEDDILDTYREHVLGLLLSHYISVVDITKKQPKSDTSPQIDYSSSVCICNTIKHMNISDFDKDLLRKLISDNRPSFDQYAEFAKHPLFVGSNDMDQMWWNPKLGFPDHSIDHKEREDMRSDLKDRCNEERILFIMAVLNRYRPQPTIFTTTTKHSYDNKIV